MAFTVDDIVDMFSHHAPTAEKMERYEAIRAAARMFALVLIANSQPSPDQSAAIRHLRECVFTINAAIALEKN
jgi:hypothetical protein